MRSLCIASLLTLTALSGCTFNVQTLEEDVVSETTESLSRLRLAATDAGVPIEGDIVIRGADRVGAAATLTLEGLVGASEDPDAIASALDVRWHSGGDPVMELLVSYDGSAAESVWVGDMTVELPLGTSLDATIGSASIDVAGLDAELVGIDASSGSMIVRDAREVLLQADSGSIDVEAEHGSVMARSGSIRAMLTGPMRAGARSGSIRGTFGGHAEAFTLSGSIELELLGELDDDVLLGAGSGSVTLVVPPGVGMNLELTADSGSVTVSAGDIDHSGPDFTGALNGGGTFTVRIGTDSGSVTVIERGAR